MRRSNPSPAPRRWSHRCIVSPRDCLGSGATRRSDFKVLCGKLGLQTRGTGGVDSALTGGTWDISDADRFGKVEVQLYNILIEGAAKLTGLEDILQSGKVAEAEAAIAAIGGGN